MTTFLMFGKYSADGLKAMSAQRTESAVEAIGQCSGEVEAMYALLGPYDLLLVTSFPTIEDAMKASVFISRMTGIAFTTAPAVSVAQFDQLMSDT